MANACPACGKKYTLPAGSVGRAFVCKRCGLKLEIAEHGLIVPSVPDAGPPVPPPQPVNHGPLPAIDVEPVAAVAPGVYAAYAPTPTFPVAAPPQPAAAPPRERFDDFEDEEDEPLSRPRPVGSNVLLDYLLLRRHIAPTLIVVFFWSGTAMLLLSGLSTIVGSFDAPKGISLSGGGGLDLGGLDAAGGGGLGLPGIKQERGFSFPLFFFGVVQLFIGPIVLRVMCEFVIVVFRINESLLAMKDQLGRDRS